MLINYKTVHKIIQKYKQNGKVIHPRPHLNVGRKPKLTPEISTFISRKETLKDWVALGLKERVLKIEE